MKFILLSLLLMIVNPALAKETVTVYSKFNLTDVGSRQIDAFVDMLNQNSNKYEFRIRSLPGAFGEASVRRSIVDARSGVKVLLFNTVDIVTVLKELENKDPDFVYDKSVDLIPLQGISSTFHGLFARPEIGDIDSLIVQLRKEPQFFYGYTSNAVVPKLSADSFIKHHKLTNGKLVLYKSQSDLELAVLNGEIRFAVGSVTQAISDNNLKLLLSTSKSRSQFYPETPTGIEKGVLNFKYNAQTVLFIPKELAAFGQEMSATLKSVCDSREYGKILTSLRRTQSCLTSDQLKEFIEEEYGWYLANK